MLVELEFECVFSCCTDFVAAIDVIFECSPPSDHVLVRREGFSVRLHGLYVLGVRL